MKPRKHVEHKGPRLTRDIIVPEGAAAMVVGTVTSTRIDAVSVLIALDRDATAELVMHRDDAERLGLLAYPQREAA